MHLYPVQSVASTHHKYQYPHCALSLLFVGMYSFDYYPLILQCLDEIKRALADPHVRPPRRLSLIKRARKLCESLSVNAKKQRKNESSAKRRKPSDAGKRISKDTLRFELSDFPEMEIIPAQEV